MRERSTRVALACLGLCMLAGIAAAPFEAETVTTVVVLRHAEKRAGQGADPSLDRRGRARAKALARLLADARVTALSATQYRRTVETLEPLARRLDLPIDVRPVDTADLAGWAREMAAALLAEHAGGTVVVAGHSNTVPRLLEALGIDDPPPVADDAYDDLFLVRVGPGDSRSMLHLHYGEPSP